MMLRYPTIMDNNKIVGYGGNQKWYHDRFARLAGCGSVCATNVVAYYSGKYEYTKQEYVLKQEMIYEKVKPGNRGYPYVYLYARRMREILNKDFEIIRNPNYDQGMAFIKLAIDHHNPVSMLILTHRSLRLRDERWHWVTIFGYDERYVYISTYGKIKKVRSDILFKRHASNVIKMVRLY